MTVYQVRLINREIGLNKTIEVPENDYILDKAEDNGISLPSGCKQGECSACVAKLMEGQVDLSEQKFLQPAEIEAGYILTCVVSPLSDCTLMTHQENVLYHSSLYVKK